MNHMYNIFLDGYRILYEMALIAELGDGRPTYEKLGEIACVTEQSVKLRLKKGWHPDDCKKLAERLGVSEKKLRIPYPPFKKTMVDKRTFVDIFSAKEGQKVSLAFIARRLRITDQALAYRFRTGWHHLDLVMVAKYCEVKVEDFGGEA